jgi:two-component system LytT family response regulator
MGKPIRCVIVDDEVLAREGLRSIAQKDPDLRVIAECSNGTQAVETIRAMRPELVFLDIQMPEVDGFGVLNQLKRDPLPYIIFVTAYDQYAVRAFDVHALDYLLKPVDEERFARALERAKPVLHSDSEWMSRIVHFLQEVEAEQNRYSARFVIKEEGRIFFVNTSEIDWIEAKGNYALVHAGKKSHLIREAMNSLEGQLNPHKFFRIHRSTIVNIERIREMQPLFHGDCRITLHDGTKLLMSRRFRDKLRTHLSL